MKTSLRLALGLWLSCSLLFAAAVRVENPFGSINVRVADVGKVLLDPKSDVRKLRAGDVRVIRREGLSVVKCTPEDGIPIDIDLQIPYGLALQARTTKGGISVTGLVRNADLITESGDLKLAAPWEATRLWIGADQEPRKYLAPKGLKLRVERVLRDEDVSDAWVLTNRFRG